MEADSHVTEAFLKHVLIALLAGASLAYAAAPAFAQQKTQDDLTDAQLNEAYCVYDYLDGLGDKEALTSAHIAGDREGSAYKAAMAVVDAGAAACKQTYGWTGDRMDLAGLLATYAVMGDVLEARLKAKGLTDKQVEGVYAATETLSRKDFDAFVDGSWMTNSDLQQRLKTALGQQGIAGDSVLTEAFYKAQTYVVVSVLMTHWIAGMPKG